MREHGRNFIPPTPARLEAHGAKHSMKSAEATHMAYFLCLSVSQEQQQQFALCETSAAQKKQLLVNHERTIVDLRDKIAALEGDLQTVYSARTTYIYTQKHRICQIFSSPTATEFFSPAPPLPHSSPPSRATRKRSALRRTSTSSCSNSAFATKRRSTVDNIDPMARRSDTAHRSRTFLSLSLSLRKERRLFCVLYHW